MRITSNTTSAGTGRTAIVFLPNSNENGDSLVVEVSINGTYSTSCAVTVNGSTAQTYIPNQSNSAYTLTVIDNTSTSAYYHNWNTLSFHT